MTARMAVSRVAIGALGLSLALGGLTAAPLVAHAATTYSNLVMNIGGTADARNFVWYSDASGTQQLKLTAKGDAAATPQLFSATDSGASNEQAGQYVYHLSVSGLELGTTYEWQVGSDADGWSDIYEFTTQNDATIDALVFGDPQIGSGGGQPTDAGAWQNTLDAALGAKPNPDFLLSVGDQVDTHNSAQQYTQFLAPDALRTNALATNIGNHDDGGALDPQHSYAEHFNMPNRTGLEGWNNEMGNYWYIQNNTLFVSLNSNEQDPAKHETWLRDVVAQHGQGVDWKVATWHHSLYSTASHATDGDIENRRTWMPKLMSELDFDLVLSGHDHVYNRTHLINQGWPVGDLSAPSSLAKFDGEVLYITMNSSTGSKYYTIQEGIDFTYNAVQSQNRTTSFGHLQITPESIRVVTSETTGAVLDDVTLTRAPEGATPNPVPPGDAPTVFEGPSLVDDPIENVVDPTTGEVTVEARILSPNDDVEEYVTNGEMYLDSSDLEVTQESPGDADPETQSIGLRYDQVGIPAGATITSAYVQFTTDEHEKTGDPFDVTIHGEATGHSRPYSEDAGDVTGRTYLDTTVAWKDAPTWTTNGEAGADQRTPDLTALIQEIVDQDDWARGGALSLMLTGTGTRTAEAYEGGTGAEAPRLFVTYVLDDVVEVQGTLKNDRDDVEQYVAGDKAGLMDHGSSDLEIVDEKPANPGANKQLIGLRYDGLEIPQGAEIISARVQFTTDEQDKNTDPFNVEIRAENVDSSVPFGDAANDLSNRTLTETAATWTGVDHWLVEHESGPRQRTPELKDVVQAVVDRDGWASGNALTLMLSGEGQRSAEALEGEPTMGAELWISYRMPETTTPTTTATPGPTSTETQTETPAPANPEVIVEKDTYVQADTINGIAYAGQGWEPGAQFVVELVYPDGSVGLIPSTDGSKQVIEADGAFSRKITLQTDTDGDGVVDTPTVFDLGGYTIRVTQTGADGSVTVREATFSVVGADGEQGPTASPTTGETGAPTSTPVAPTQTGGGTTAVGDSLATTGATADAVIPIGIVTLLLLGTGAFLALRARRDA